MVSRPGQIVWRLADNHPTCVSGMARFYASIPAVRQFELRIDEVASAGGSVWLECTGPDPGARPGQPLLALSGRTGQPFLRVPIFLMPVAGHRAGFYVPAIHPYA